MLSTVSLTREAVRTIIVYRNAFLRDLALRILTDAGADVTAVIQHGDLSQSVLEVLQPDVIVIDQSAEGLTSTLAESTIFNQSLTRLTRVVTVGLANSTLVVCNRRLVHGASAQSLVEAVLGGLTSKLGSSDIA